MTYNLLAVQLSNVSLCIFALWIKVPEEHGHSLVIEPRSYFVF